MKIERCGFCGRFFRGAEYLSAEELNKTKEEVLNKVLHGYCPNAEGEQEETEPAMHQVTRDMASDAGDPNLEGTWI